MAYFLSLYNSLAATSKHIETSLPGAKPALSIASRINSIAASDAFFPFPDGIQELIKVGVKAIIQPGGSINDKKIIKVANKSNIVMAFTETRHFKH